jgi:hypothetical protein
MLSDFLSEQRLKKYGLGQVDEPLVIARYKWNLALSEALYPSLSLLEIGLRNRMDAALSMLYGPQWLHEDCTYWVRTPWMQAKRLPNPEQDAILKAKQKLVRENGEWNHPKLVAELNFGFWTNLFKSHYHPPIWHRKEKPMKMVFPESPKISPKQAYEELNRVKILRNRTAHHEAIWNKPTLQEDYQTIFRLLSALGQPLKLMATDLDRFPSVWMAKPE